MRKVNFAMGVERWDVVCARSFWFLHWLQKLPPDVIFGSSAAGESVRVRAEMAVTTRVPALL